jgi:hypothetical protein
MEELDNIGTCLVHYTVTPTLSAEGDEDDATAMGYITDAFHEGRMKYVGFTFPETPDRLPEVEGMTNLYFTVPVAGVTPFQSEEDFEGILSNLEHHDGEITDGVYYEDSSNIKRMDITLTNVVNKPL